MGQEVKSVQDFFAVVKRRRTGIAVTATVIFLVSALVAFLIPPNYRSTSTILIEEQEVPRDYVNTTVTSLLEFLAINGWIMDPTSWAIFFTLNVSR